MHLAAGDKVDEKYVIRSVLGTGGFGTVYQAEHEALGRSVALKLLTDCTDAELTARLMREAQALSTIHHRNVIQCFGYGTFLGVPYIAVEYVPGQSLQDELNAGKPLPCERVLDITTQVCDGLSEAHRQGIVHRDLKPANILLCKTASGSELVKIIDFGLAKVLPEAAINAKFQQLTDMGLAIGSVRYMSPEQCLGHPATPRSDVYALGCIFYECLTGTRTYDADAAVAVMFMHLNESIPSLHPAKKNEASQKLQEVLNRALAKDVGNRYESMDEFRDDLEKIAAHKELYEHSQAAAPLVPPNTVPTATPTKPSRKLPLLLTALAGCIAIGLACYVYFSAPSAKLNDTSKTIAVAQQALLAGDYKMASREYRRVLEDPQITQDTKILARLRLCECFCAEANTDAFFNACDDLKSISLKEAYRAAAADAHEYYMLKNELLTACATLTAFDCSTASEHEQIKGLVEFIDLQIHQSHGTLLAIADNYAVDHMQKASLAINERPADFASIASTRAKLQAAGGSYSGAEETTDEIFSKLDEVHLSPEDAQAVKLLKDIHAFKPEQTKEAVALSNVVTARWLDSILWLCEYESMCGRSVPAAETAAVMAKRCQTINPSTVNWFTALATRSPLLVLRARPDPTLHPEALSELPSDPLVRAAVITRAFVKAKFIADNGRNVESLALFKAAVDACKRTGTDPCFEGNEAPRKVAGNDRKLLQNAITTLDEFYHQQPTYGRTGDVQRAHVSAQLADMAYLALEQARSEPNTQRALQYSDQDLYDTGKMDSPEWMADANFRRARLYAFLGDATKFHEYWDPAYSYYSRNKRPAVDPMLVQLVNITENSNRALANMLRDDHDVLVDGVIAYATPEDFDLIQAPQIVLKQLVDKIRPTGNHLLRTGQFAEFEKFLNAVNRAAVRTNDFRPLLALMHVAFASDQLHLGSTTQKILDTGAEFAREHEVSPVYDHVLKLQQADHNFFTRLDDTKDYTTAGFRKIEEQYKADLAAGKVVQKIENRPVNTDPIVADCEYRLARLYATGGDTTNFWPLWHKALEWYVRSPSQRVSEERVEELARTVGERGGKPEFIAQIKSDASAIRGRVHKN